MRVDFRLFALTFVFSVCTIFAGEAKNPERFNEYIIKSVEEVLSQRTNGGYKMGGTAFTRKLDYGPYKSAIEPMNPPLTMCVAAVGEAIVEGLNLYYSKDPKGHSAAFDRLDKQGWSPRGAPLAGFIQFLFSREFCTCKGKQLAVQNGIKSYDCDSEFLKDLGQKSFGNPRHYLTSEYYVTLTKGSGEAFRKFGIGRELPLTEFNNLQRGDFINFSRTTRGGHAVIFWNYISARSGEVQKYTTDDDIIGFRYYSAQQGGTNGLGFKLAYFDGKCPADGNAIYDCKVVKRTLVLGYMLHPDYWTTETAAKDVLAELRERNLVGCDYRNLPPRQERTLQNVLRLESDNIRLRATRPNISDFSAEDRTRIDRTQKRFSPGFVDSIAAELASDFANERFRTPSNYDGITPTSD